MDKQPLVDSGSPAVNSNGGSTVYKRYRHRWTTLAIVMLLQIANAMLWIVYSPIALIAKEHYHTQTTTINWLSMAFMVIYLVAGESLFSLFFVLSPWRAHAWRPSCLFSLSRFSLSLFLSSSLFSLVSSLITLLGFFDVPTLYYDLIEPVITGPISSYGLDTFGLRKTMVVAAWLNMLGGWVRYVRVLPFLCSRSTQHIYVCPQDTVECVLWYIIDGAPSKVLAARCHNSPPSPPRNLLVHNS